MMMKKILPAFLYSILIVWSYAGVCATTDSDIIASEKSPTEVNESAQTTLKASQTVAAKPVATPASSVTPVKPDTLLPSKTDSVTVAPVKPASAPVVPVNPATAQAVPASPGTAPTVPEKSLPASVIPKKPILLPDTKPAPASRVAIPAKPVHTPPAQAIKALPPKALLKPVHAPGIPAQPNNLQTEPANLSANPATDPLSHTVDIEVFMREGCLNCDKATEFLNKLKVIKPQLKINIRDVRKEPAALELLKRVAQNQGDPALDYPAFVVGGQLIIGFSEVANTAQQILDNMPISVSASNQSGTGIPECETGKEPSCGLIPATPTEKPEKIIFNVYGYKIPLSHIGLPVLTIAMGMLDGLNHASTWVLILMISLLAPLKDRTRMLTIAGTFITVQTLIYFVLLVAWFNLIALINISRSIQMIFGAASLLAGMFYFKKYLFFGQTLSLISHEITKPGIYTYIRKIAQAQTLIASILGTIALAIVVQISELTYTSVFPALYNAVLTMQKLGTLHNYGYLALYDFAYILDDLIILAIAVVTLKPVQPRVRKVTSQLLASSLMLLALGIYIFMTLFLVI
jgi:hypothetical protein